MRILVGIIPTAIIVFLHVVIEFDLEAVGQSCVDDVPGFYEKHGGNPVRRRRETDPRQGTVGQ